MNNDLMNFVSETLREVRCGKKITYNELSKFLGVHRETVRKYENHPEKMDVGLFIRELNYLNEDIIIFFNKIMAKCHKRE